MSPRRWRTSFGEGTPAARRSAGPELPAREQILSAIAAHEEVSILANDPVEGLCLFPRSDGAREWCVYAYVRDQCVAPFMPSRAAATGRVIVREGGVNVDHGAARSVTPAVATAIARQFLRGALTIEDAPRYRWSLPDPIEPDTSPHRLVRLRAIYRARPAK
jgi:hypothetical protein